MSQGAWEAGLDEVVGLVGFARLVGLVWLVGLAGLVCLVRIARLVWLVGFARLHIVALAMSCWIGVALVDGGVTT